MEMCIDAECLSRPASKHALERWRRIALRANGWLTTNKLPITGELALAAALCTTEMHKQYAKIGRYHGDMHFSFWSLLFILLEYYNIRPEGRFSSRPLTEY